MLFSSSAAVYGLKTSGRALAAVVGGDDSEPLDRHLFFAGTLSIQDNTNEVHLIDYNEDTNSISPIAIFPHHGEVWQIAPCPGQPSTFITVFKQSGSLTPQAALYSYDYADALADRLGAEAALDQEVILATQDNEIGALNGASWSLPNSGSTSRSVATTHSNGVRIWDIYNSTVSQHKTFTHKVSASCWDPHHTDQISVAVKSDVVNLDVRSMEVAHRISDAHGTGMRVLDLDYNPNKPYYIVTGGDDGRVRFWDIRKETDPVRVLHEHSHWVCNVKYNRFHDQLVMSSSTDNLVKLWRMSSISSAPLLELDDDDMSSLGGGDQQGSTEGRVSKQQGTEDAIIKSYDDHDESVYGAAWSGCDAWVFATMSYNGKVVINHVPSAEKYKILL